jgi:sugar-specific transcriptional regulator TrmB
MEELRKILGEIGMSSYKIETYLALLKLKTGSGTIQQIAKNCSVPACKLYENLKWLHENGYITLISEKPLSYRANDPKSIINSEIEKRKDKLDEVKKETENIKLELPEAEKNIVQITSTREAYFRKVKESLRNVKKSIIYTAKHWKVDADLIRLLQERIKQGVKIRALGPISAGEKKNVEWLKEIGVKIKETELKDTRFSVYDDSLVIISLRKEPEKSDYPAIWIKSDTLAELVKNYFEELWKTK